MLGGLDLSAEGGEDSLVQVMEGVMSTLLSKEVLCPSLSELCSQVTHSHASAVTDVCPAVSTPSGWTATSMNCHQRSTLATAASWR